MKGLDWAYDQAVNGSPFLKSAEDLGAEFKQTYTAGTDSLDVCAKRLVRWQMAKAGTSGFISGLGGVLTLPVAIPANLASVMFVQIRMIAAIAHLRVARSAERPGSGSVLCLHVWPRSGRCRQACPHKARHETDRARHQANLRQGPHAHQPGGRLSSLHQVWGKRFHQLWQDGTAHRWCCGRDVRRDQHPDHRDDRTNDIHWREYRSGRLIAKGSLTFHACQHGLRRFVVHATDDRLMQGLDLFRQRDRCGPSPCAAHDASGFAGSAGTGSGRAALPGRRVPASCI